MPSNFIQKRSDSLCPTFRHITNKDIGPITKYLKSKKVAKHLTWKPYKNKRDIELYLQHAIKSCAFPDEILAIVLLGKVIGTAHIIQSQNAIQFGFGILPEYWNYGIGKKILSELIIYINQSEWHKKSDTIFCAINEKNEAAKRILLKADFIRDSNYIKSKRICYSFRLNICDLPKIIKQAFNKNYLIGAVQFGSSLRSAQFHDIDIALFVRDRYWRNFLLSIKNYKFHKKFDFSLIKESEINPKFFFGTHGRYLIEAIQQGRTILGSNPFHDYKKVSETLIRRDIFQRLKEYIYILRKGYFKKESPKIVDLARYEKYLRLSAYLFSENLQFKDSFRLDREVVNGILKQNNIFVGRDRAENMENIWSKLRRRY